MGGNTFSRRQCVRALLKMGFILANKRSGKHDKFKAPFTRADLPFIMVPRHKDLHCQDAIIKELEKMGGKKLVDEFRSHL